jgi:glyoxylase-like metal-dependent hydrolase (beta-lactamase superfamily II)
MTLEIFEHRVVGPLACNCYVAGDPETRTALILDPGGDADELAQAIAGRGLEVAAIVATHAHFDHVLGAARLRELLGVPFLLHENDGPLLSWLQESGRLWLGIELPAPPEVDDFPHEGDVIVAGGVDFGVLHTPGHSPGSISLVAEDAVFSGDTLFAGSIGRTDLPGGSAEALLAAIRQKLFALDPEVAVHPGHGPSTSVGRELRSNPFVGRGAGP